MRTAVAVKPRFEYGSVPRQWPDATIVCLATGPSLTKDDAEYCRGRAVVVAIKNAIDLAPWADVLYGCGADTSKWWHRNGDALKWFTGLRFTLDPKATQWATLLRYTGAAGLEMDPAALRTGKNSGYQAINLAVHLGAKKIVLVGYDMQVDATKGSHFFGEHPTKNVPPVREFRPMFATLVEPLAAIGVSVINASRVSALETFPKMSLAEALA